jgi:hypothetical protein
MMPEESRSGLYDPDEEYAWDCDLDAPGESDVADLLDDSDG